MAGWRRIVHVNEKAILSRLSIKGFTYDSYRHGLNGFQRSFGYFPWGVVAAVVAVVLFCGHTQANAAGLTINPTFDSSITSLPGAAGIESAINSAITAVESSITSPNNITVSIDFQNMSSGLGQSLTTEYDVHLLWLLQPFKAVATSPDQLTALASLGPAPTSQPRATRSMATR